MAWCIDCDEEVTPVKEPEGVIFIRVPFAIPYGGVEIREVIVCTCCYVDRRGRGEQLIQHPHRIKWAALNAEEKQW